MQKKLTITVDEKIYQGLHRVVGRRNISGYIEGLVRAHVLERDLQRGYKEMARDKNREREALEWSEALIEDPKDEAR